MRTEHSVSPSLTGADVLWSLLAYVAVYLLMYPAGIAVMARMVRQGPREEVMVTRPVEALQPRSPIVGTPAAVSGE
jgi:cytochrome d ubiquinol oxidase subunit I